MKLTPPQRQRVTANVRRWVGEQYGKAIDLNADPAVLERIIDEIADSMDDLPVQPQLSPFSVSWLDSYLAHWELREHLPPREQRARDITEVVRELVDVKFDERIVDIRNFIHHRRVSEPPDGGPPEPGVPPTGPARSDPPDGGPPEPGVPPTGPTGARLFEPPDGGPPEPGVPPTGPEAGFLAENPWILYWFVSLKAPMLLDVVDAHIGRRMSELGFPR